MSIENSLNKKNVKVIDAISYNGKYVDSSIVRKRAIYATVAVAALICFIVIILL